MNVTNFSGAYIKIYVLKAGFIQKKPEMDEFCLTNVPLKQEIIYSERNMYLKKEDTYWVNRYVC